MSLYSACHTLVSIYHKDQTYGGGSYVDAHLVPVSLLAQHIAESFGLTEAEVEGISCLGLIHDLLEDTDCFPDTVRSVENMPGWVVDGMWTLTKDSIKSYSYYLNEIVKAGIYPIIVKLADSICNYRACISEGNIEKSRKYSSNIDFLTTALGREIEKRKKSKV